MLAKIGRIVGAHGIRGQVKVEPLTDFPERMGKGVRLKINDDWREVEDYFIHKGRPILRLSGVSDRNAAEALRGAFVEAILSERPPLEEDEFLVDDLIGLAARTVDGAELGIIDDVLHYPAQDLLKIGDLLVPLVREFVTAIDLIQGTLTVRLIPGMSPGEEDA
jgi:16S rRNA processing protein RimM